MPTNGNTFATRLKRGDILVGTFMKTPSPIIAEVLCKTALDMVCLDAEHAPFGRLELDLCLAALRAGGMPSLVRVSEGSSEHIRNALDSGATGIMVPHVTTPGQAEWIVRAAHFGFGAVGGGGESGHGGGRGYAGSTRAADFTRKGMEQHLADSRKETVIILQIEDIAALENIGAIAAVEGVHGLFVGRADLAVAMGKPLADAEVVDAVLAICAAVAAMNTGADAGDGTRVGTGEKDAAPALGMFTGDWSELPGWIERGASFFLLGSDQGMILNGADRMVERVKP